MQNYLNTRPLDERPAEIEKYETGVAEGSYDPLPIYKGAVEMRSLDTMLNRLQIWSGLGVLSGGVALAVTGLGPIVAIGAAATIVITGGRTSLTKRREDIEALEEDEFGHLLTDRELKELGSIVDRYGTPKTPALEQSLKIVRRIVDEETMVVSEPALPEAIEVEATEVGEEDPFGGLPIDDVSGFDFDADEPAVNEVCFDDIADDDLNKGEAEAYGLAEPEPMWKQLFSRAIDEGLVISISGGQGSGKTTVANYLLGLSDGYAIACDPHASLTAWEGCEVRGKGMRYEEINETLKETESIIKARYAEMAETGNENFSPIIYICEELTNWKKRTKGVDEFIQSSLSDFRKVGLSLIKVSHGQTNAAQGGAVGTSEMREQGEVIIELSKIGPATFSFFGAESFTVELPLHQIREATQKNKSRILPEDLRGLRDSKKPENKSEVKSLSISTEAEYQNQQSNDTFSGAEIAAFQQEEVAKQVVATEPEEPLIPGTNLTQSKVVKRIVESAKKAAPSRIGVRGNKAENVTAVGQCFSGANRPGLKNAKSFDTAFRFLATRYSESFQLTKTENGSLALLYIGLSVSKDVVAKNS